MQGQDGWISAPWIALKPFTERWLEPAAPGLFGVVAHKAKFTQCGDPLKTEHSQIIKAAEAWDPLVEAS